MKKSQLQKTAKVFRSLMNISIEMNKTAKYYGTDIQIFPAEIHYLVTIHQSNVINVTDLAKQMGVTKGAVSQIITKLGKKGLIERFKKDDNDKAVYISLTDLGKIAEAEHRKMEADFFARLYDNLADVTEDEANKFHDILQQIEKTIKQ